MKFSKLFDYAKTLGISELEIRKSTTNNSKIKSFNKVFEGSTTSKYISYNFRGIFNNKMGYSYTESDDLNDLKEAINSLIESSKSNTSTEQEFIYDNKDEVYETIDESNEYDILSNDNYLKIEKLIEFEKLLYVDPLINSTKASFNEFLNITTITNSKGLNLSRKSSYNYIVLEAVAKSGDISKNGYAFSISKKFFDFDKDELIKDATYDAIKQINAITPKSTVTDVVLKSTVVSDLLEAFLSNFSAESLIRKTTKLEDKVNKKVFGDNITIIDDPYYSKALVKYNFDDEGVSTKKTTLVENGVFKGFLHNLKTANTCNTTSTGNGFMSSSTIRVSPTNIYLKEENNSFNDLISSCDKGIYITDLQGLHAGFNPSSGDFSLQASGYLIEQGKITNALTLFMISSNFYDLFNNIELIGNDIKENTLGASAASVKVKNISISGK